MLDINAVSAFLRRRSPRLDGWVRALAESTLDTLEILPWTEACSRIDGRLRAELERHGKPLAALDLLIRQPCPQRRLCPGQRRSGFCPCR
jgi:tRNA(fMet)-specific endonuclease VapC